MSSIKPLVKAMSPEIIKTLKEGTDMRGVDEVDHTPHLDAHPPHLNSEVHNYRSKVLSPSTIYEPVTKEHFNKEVGKENLGVTPKAIVSHEGQKFLIKPYHEEIGNDFRTFMDKRHLGWAEMTNQALYHAAGIGHLHQNVHVSEHDMGDGTVAPQIVIHMSPGYKNVTKVDGHNSKNFFPKDSVNDLRKIFLMDFLTNNMDRHSQNIMYNQGSSKFLAIDHGRSFQYRNNPSKKWDDLKNVIELTDNLGKYLGNSTDKAFDIAHEIDTWHILGNETAEYRRMREYQDLLQNWWAPRSEEISNTFMKHVDSSIKNPKERDFLKKNFNERSSLLNKLAAEGLEQYHNNENSDVSWERMPVKIHRPRLKVK